MEGVLCSQKLLISHHVWCEFTDKINSGQGIDQTGKNKEYECQFSLERSKIQGVKSAG